MRRLLAPMLLVADEKVAHHERVEVKERAAFGTRAAVQVAVRLLPRHGFLASENLVAVENGVDDAERRFARRPLRVRVCRGLSRAAAHYLALDRCD